MNQMQQDYNEEGYYSDGSMWVTSRRLIYGGGYHLLSSVRGVRVRVVRAEDRLRDMIISLLTYTGIFVLLLFSPNQNIVLRVISICGLLLVPGVSILLVLKRAKMPQEPVYTVSIRYRFWSKTVAASTDRAYIERIVEVIQYALARRDGTASTMIAPASIGYSFEVPTPTISANTLYAGQATYDLSDIRSVQVETLSIVSSITIRAWAIYTVLLLPQYVDYYLEAPWRAYSFMIGLFIISMGIITIIMAPSNSWGEIYPVVLTPRTGPRAIVYASTNRREVEQVRQSIKAGRAAKAAPVTA